MMSLFWLGWTLCCGQMAGSVASCLEDKKLEVTPDDQVSWPRPSSLPQRIVPQITLWPFAIHYSLDIMSCSTIWSQLLVETLNNCIKQVLTFSRNSLQINPDTGLFCRNLGLVPGNVGWDTCQEDGFRVDFPANHFCSLLVYHDPLCVTVLT
jgi:hypothetical protein